MLKKSKLKANVREVYMPTKIILHVLFYYYCTHIYNARNANTFYFNVIFGVAPVAFSINVS